MAGRRGLVSLWLPIDMNMLLLVFTCWIALCSASPEFYISEQMVDSADVSVLNSGRLLVDLRPPPARPNPKAWTLATKEDALQKRGMAAEDNNNKDEPTSSSSSASEQKTTMASSDSTTQAPEHHTTTTTTKSSPTSAAASSSAALTTQSSQPSSSPLPKPFDQGFGGNTTENCSNFIYGFLSDQSFTSCLPFSLLLQNSEGFFQASKSVLTLSRILDATCAANVNTCSEYMNQLSGNLTKTCATDLAGGNPAILQAQLGLDAYNTLYTASCLRNPSTSAYCYAEAVTNTSSPTDPYIYYLPLNVSLPGGGAPTCNTCLVDTMAVFEQATSNRGSAIAHDYSAAAQQIDLHCGPSFVNTTLAAATTSIAGRTSAPGTEFALVVFLGALLFGAL